MRSVSDPVRGVLRCAHVPDISKLLPDSGCQREQGALSGEDRGYQQRANSQSDERARFLTDAYSHATRWRQLQNRYKVGFSWKTSFTSSCNMYSLRWRYGDPQKASTAFRASSADDEDVPQRRHVTEKDAPTPSTVSIATSTTTSRPTTAPHGSRIDGDSTNSTPFKT